MASLCHSPLQTLLSTQLQQGVYPVSAVDQIASEYNQKLLELANLTADLPRRLQSSSDVQTRSSKQDHHEPSTGAPLQLADSCVQIEIPNTSRMATFLNASAPAHAKTTDDHLTKDMMETANSPIVRAASNASFASEFSGRIELESTGSRSRSICSSMPLRFEGDTRSPCGLTGSTSPGRGLDLRRGCKASPTIARSYDLKNEWYFVKDTASEERFSKARLAQISRKSVDDGKTRRPVDDTTSVASTTSSFFRSSTSIRREQTTKASWAKKLVSKPTSSIRMGWELCGLILVIYDLLATPFQVAFKPPHGLYSDVLGWIVVIFWTANIPVVLTTGYFSNGVLILNLWSIMLHYLKTWCVVDLLTLTPDWVFILGNIASDVDNEDNAGSCLRSLRVARLLRLTRLLRMLRLGKAWSLFYDIIDSDQLGILFQGLSVIFSLMMLTHFNACIWFAIGNAQAGNSWLKVHKFAAEDASLLEQYLVSYHWAITLFTPASMDVQPQSVGERAFAVTVVILGMVGFSYLVGRITGSLNRLSAMKEQKSNDFRLLRKYLKENHVQRDLSVRIRSYLENRWDHQQKSIKSSDVELLNLLSEHLRAELACAVHGPSLLIHPLFFQLEQDSNSTVRRVTLKGISLMSWAPQDEMFLAGEEASHMLVVTSGNVEYHLMNGADEDLQDIRVETLASNEGWIAEQVLWVSNWHHIGDLHSITSTDVLRLSPMRFAEIAKQNPVAQHMITSYAREYIKWLNGISRQVVSEIAKQDSVADELRGIVARVRSLGNKNPGSSRTSFRVSLITRLFKTP